MLYGKKNMYNIKKMEVLCEMKNIIDEHKSRQKKENSFNVVGTEIRDRRLSLSRTQSALSSELCSISYFSKIENNKIIPKIYYLKEICKRLDLKDEKIDILLNLDISLQKTVKFFLMGESNEIFKVKEEGAGLINYRYKIIELIYSLSIKDYVSANQNSATLLKIISTMTDEDLIIFSLFYGVLLFYNQEFDYALESLDSLNRYYFLSPTMKILQSQYKTYLSLVLNKPTFLIDYQSTIQLLVENGYYERIDEMNYLHALFMFQNGNIYEYSKILRRIKAPIYRRTLIVLAKLKYGKNLKWKEEWLEGIRPFFYYIVLLKTRKIEARNKIEKLNDTSFDYDFNLLYLEYLVLDSNESKYNFIKNVSIPTIRRTNGGYSKTFFLKEMALLTRENGKYKAFNDMYMDLGL